VIDDEIALHLAEQEPTPPEVVEAV
jgi:hypothetical protein